MMADGIAQAPTNNVSELFFTLMKRRIWTPRAVFDCMGTAGVMGLNGAASISASTI